MRGTGRGRAAERPSVGIAGAGFMATVHGLAARTLGLAVPAVAGRRPERVAERAQQLGAAVCTVEELADRSELVVVATPPSTHAAIALDALARGATVLVEKPLCTTLADADRLVEATATGPRLAYGENLVFAPVVVRALEAAARLGPLRHAEVRAVQGRPHWGGFLERSWGGGALFDLGAHPVALALLLAGRDHPVAVRAELRGGDGHDADEHGEVELDLASGTRVHLVASWAAGSPLWDLQAASSDGVVRAELLPHPTLEVNGDPVPLPASAVQPPELEQYGYLGQLDLLIRDVVRAQPPWPDAVFGRRVLDVLCAAYRSAGEGGAPVSLPFEGPRDRTPHQLWTGAD